MSEFARKFAAARDRVQVSWDDDRAREVAGHVTRTVRRRAQQRVAVRAAAAVALLVAAGALGQRWTRAGSEAPVAHAPRATQRLADGSTITPFDARTVLHVREASATRVAVDLARGGARFDVVRAPSRVFRVEAGNVAVQVLGTVFSVDHAGARVRVGVTEGRVRVFWGAHVADVGAGEVGVFPRDDVPEPAATPTNASAPTAEAPDAAQPAATAPPVARPPAPRAVAATRAWHALADGGDYDQAYAALQRDGLSSVRDEPGDLLLAADAARYSGHPGDALAPLRRVVDRHASDRRAPLAAFTLGRVLLEEVGQPRDAATAFARARALDPEGSLAEDALAREVEAYSRGGDTATANRLAREYVERYPAGGRMRAVRRFGGLE